jgi:type I restriction enzyme R subunit
MNFEKLPETREDRNMFAKCFSEMTHLLEAAKLQGFVWEKSEYGSSMAVPIQRSRWNWTSRPISSCFSAT